jgi:hypothetical protein
LATVSVQVSPASSVFRPALAGNRLASRKVSFQAGLAERTYFLEPLCLAKHPAHLAVLPEHFCLATASLQASSPSSLFRPARSENRLASRKVSLQAGLVERISCQHPLHLAKRPEQHSRLAHPRQVSPNWAVVSAQYPQAESRSRPATRLRPESR